MSMPATRHRFTVDDWHQMIRAGVLREDQRLELLDGEIYEMTPIGPRHNSVVDRLTRFWVTRLGERAIVRVQGSVTAGPRSEPEPDLAMLRERSDFYRERQPGPQDLLLITEVAERSRDYDHAKLRIYATAGVAEVWIVDLENECVEVHRAPRAGTYDDVNVIRGAQPLSCLAFPDVALTAADVLGSAPRPR